jgi:hypothetical protein
MLQRQVERRCAAIKGKALLTANKMTKRCRRRVPSVKVRLVRHLQPARCGVQSGRPVPVLALFPLHLYRSANPPHPTTRLLQVLWRKRMHVAVT